MKIYITILLFFFTLLASAQKETTQELDATEIKNLYIDTDEVFKINIKTIKGDHIFISTHADGEYYNDIALSTTIEGKGVYLTSQFREILQSGYDKLSAHKVFSLELSLEIPENLQVYVKSNLASVEAEGAYEYLQVQLNSGYCNLNNFEGNALINTYNGAILIKTLGATVIASSRNGKVFLPAKNNGNYKIKATSINGDIRVEEN
jgi:hypothetical protein